MMKVYKCKKEFYVDNDDDEVGGYFEVEKDSVWEYDEENQEMIIGSYDEHVRLERDMSKGYQWIEIPKELLVEYFELVKDGGIDDNR